jgi:transposase
VERILKKVAGVDIAQKELVVSLGRLLESLAIEIFAYKVFVNSDKGIQSMIEWVSSCSENAAQLPYVTEATGVYHERLAYALESMNIDLSLILPNKISNYAGLLILKL